MKSRRLTLRLAVTLLMNTLFVNDAYAADKPTEYRCPAEHAQSRADTGRCG